MLALSIILDFFMVAVLGLFAACFCYIARRCKQISKTAKMPGMGLKRSLRREVEAWKGDPVTCALDCAAVGRGSHRRRRGRRNTGDGSLCYRDIG